MYIDPDKRLEDNRSTAWSFSVVGAVGLIFLLLFDLGVLPIDVAVSQKAILSAVMGIVFLVFFLIGISSFLSSKKLQELATQETSLEKEITGWFLSEHAKPLAAYRTDDMDDDDPQSLYYPRYDRISELISEKYPAISEEFKDHLVEELYTEIFSD